MDNFIIGFIAGTTSGIWVCYFVIRYKTWRLKRYIRKCQNLASSILPSFPAPDKDKENTHYVH